MHSRWRCVHGPLGVYLSYYTLSLVMYELLSPFSDTSLVTFSFKVVGYMRLITHNAEQ